MTGILSKSTVTVIKGSVNIKKVENNFKVSTDDDRVTLTVEGSNYVLRSHKHLKADFLEEEAYKLADTLVNYGDIPLLTSRGVEVVDIFSDDIDLFTNNNAPLFGSLAELLDFLGDMNGVYLR